MTNYTFGSQPNSYFRGQDMTIKREDGEEITVNRKDSMWAVNIKHDFLYNSAPPVVRLAIDSLAEGVAESIEQGVMESYWADARKLAEEHGWADIHAAGRSGGWLVVRGTWASISPADPVEEEREDVQRWIAFCFDAVALVSDAEAQLCSELQAAHQELQHELREASDWVGAKVSSLDGDRFTIERLDIRDGRAIFAEKKPAKGFSFANEVHLLDKADSKLPFSQCQGCGVSYPNDKPGHNTGCVVGALLTVLEDRGFDFAGTEIANIDADRLWESTFGPAADEIERVLTVSD